MRTRVLFAAVPALLLCVAGAQADVYDFHYVGVTDSTVFGFGTFTTGTPYSDGYVPIVSITGTTEAGTIGPGIGIETSGGAGIDPNVGSLQCCAVGPPTENGAPDFFIYDNAYSPSGPNPFSNNGLLFDTTGGIGVGTGYPLSPVNIYTDGNGNVFELNFGENTPVDQPPDFGATQIYFTASLVTTPEPGFYGVVALCMSGLLFVRWRRRRTLSDN